MYSECCARRCGVGIRLNNRPIAEAAAKYIPGGDNLSAEDIDKITGSWSPLNRPGYPEDVVGAVLLLASPHSQWLTGQTLQVSGGARMV